MFARNGTSLINKAIGQFKTIIAQIEQGIELNRQEIAKNEIEIEVLKQANTELDTAIKQGFLTASSLREMIGE